jgi:hypothetical protein
VKEFVLEVVDGKIVHVEKTSREVFKGHVSKDLAVGDLFEEIDHESGFVKKMKKVSHELTPEGYTVVVSEEVVQ